jgi:hypothetical protein
MSVRFFAFFAFAFLFSACSLAEDITPPPGFQSTVQQSTPEPTATLEPILTETPFASTRESPSVTTSAVTVTGSPVITLQGIVTNASGAAMTGPLTANLYLYNTNSSMVDQTLKTEVTKTGRYRFDFVPADPHTTYFVMVEFEGVTYSSDPGTYDGNAGSLDLPITIYNSTTEMDSLSIMQVHIQFDFLSDTDVQVQTLYVLTNSGKKSIMVTSDGTSIPFLGVPSGAQDVKYDLAQGGAAITTAVDGFALLPGAEKQYGIITTFSLPYNKQLVLSQPFSLPVDSETIIVPQGVLVESDQLQDAGTQTFQGTSYHLYQGGNLATGSNLTFTLTGRPGGATGFQLDRRTSILAGVGALGLVLIGLGIYFTFRDRLRYKREGEDFEGEVPPEVVEEDRVTIIDAIIALDEQYKRGSITRPVYEKRRTELKNRLRNLL